MRRFGGVQKHDSILPIRRSLPRHDRDPAISSRAYVIQDSAVELDCIGQFWLGWIRDVIDEQAIRNGRDVSVVAEYPLFSRLNVFHFRAADHFDVALDVAGSDHNG